MICITGAGGTVGRALLRALSRRGVRARPAYHSAARAEAARSQGLDPVTLDYHRPATLPAAFAGCDSLFLLGPNVVDQARLEINAVTAARAAGVRHVVKLSAMDAERDAYQVGASHRQVELALEASGLDWTLLRPNSFMQNVETFMLDAIRAQDAFYTASGAARVAHVDVRDIAAAAACALTEPGHAGQAYTLTGPEAFGYDELAERLSVAAGRTIRHVDLDPAELQAHLSASGMPAAMAARLVDLERYFRGGAASRITDDVRIVTGRAPRPFSDYAADIAPLLRSA